LPAIKIYFNFLPWSTGRRPTAPFSLPSMSTAMNTAKKTKQNQPTFHQNNDIPNFVGLRGEGDREEENIPKARYGT
jgi:hypothetical protein